MKINTTPGETYIVLSTGGCTVTTGAGKQIKKLTAGQDFFTAMTGDTILSDDNASVAVAKGEMLSLLNTDTTGSGIQATLQFQPVASQSALPATGENGVIYLVPNNSEAPNQYTEWVWTGSAYEQLGDVGVDLDGYVSKEELGITNIEAGETGPQVTSDATLITKAAQVESLRVGDFVSVRPSDEPYGLKDITITSTVVTLNKDSNITLSGASRINLSNTSWLGNEKAQLNSLTIMAALTFGSYGQYKFDVLGNGNLRKLNIDNSLDLGSAYYLDAYGEAQLRTLYLGLQRIYYLDSTGEGRMDTLTLDSKLNLGNTYFLNANGKGGLHQLSIMTTLDVGANLDVGGDLSLMGTLHLGGGDTYYLRPDGVGSLVSLGLERLTVMTALQLGYSSDAAQPDQVYGLTGAGDGSLRHLSVVQSLTFAARSTIGGDGWPAIVTNNIAPYLPAAAAVEAEQPSFATLTFPPTGTATEEQDPSWITKSHILMQTNGGQLNMTQLTATLAYAAQDPMSIANKTLWLSTSSGTGDAVQWPANAVFPDDQAQDKIQQLNSNSTYWYDITYVGGSDTVLIRKVCSWAATTGENGPTE